MVERTDDEGVLLPPEFFARVLPAVRDLAELKVALYTARFAREPGAPYATPERFLDPPVARDIGGSSSPEPIEIRVQRALNRAVANGTVLRIAIGNGDGREVRYVPATERHRRWIAEEAADLQGDDAAVSESPVSVYRPNIFALFERYIGPLTPLTAEQVRDAERLYPREWLDLAFAEAVRLNRRNWRYVQAMLTSWEQNGGPGGMTE